MTYIWKLTRLTSTTQAKKSVQWTNFLSRASQTNRESCHKPFRLACSKPAVRSGLESVSSFCSHWKHLVHQFPLYIILSCNGNNNRKSEVYKYFALKMQSEYNINGVHKWLKPTMRFFNLNTKQRPIKKKIITVHKKYGPISNLFFAFKSLTNKSFH